MDAERECVRTVEDLVRREWANRGYMSRVRRLTLLSPDMVQAVLHGRQPDMLRLEDLLGEIPEEWVGQRLTPINSLA